MNDGRAPAPVRALVVGLGSEDRGDDGVGAAVARAVADLRIRDVDVVEHSDPTLLIDLWEKHDPVVVVDAVHAGDDPGMLHRLHTGAALPPLPGRGWEVAGRGSTHAFGLGAAVELARALGRLPRRLSVVGVESSCFEPGAGMSPAVASSVDAAVEAVLEELGLLAVEGRDTRPWPEPPAGPAGTVEPAL